jgi:hypothetical protein
MGNERKNLKAHQSKNNGTDPSTVGAALIKNYSSYVHVLYKTKKVPHVFSPKLVLGDLKPLPDRWQTLLPSSLILSNNFSPKSTPLALNARH